MSNGYCKVMGAVIHGIDALPVQVEVSVEDGLPEMSILGMPDAEVLEARVRVREAIRSTGFTMPCGRIVVNLAPNCLRKTGAGLDLPIALGLLVATGQVSPQAIEGRLFAGALTLGGRVLPVRGTVAYALAARSLGCSFVGSADSEDFIAIEGVEQLGANDLTDFRADGLRLLLPKVLSRSSLPALDFKDVAGQEVAKRGLQIAAAGGHGVLIVGAPGSGKTMLAARMPSILPPLDENDRLQTALIHSVAGLPIEGMSSGDRPLRMPHFTVTLAGMLGGGNPIRPGEASLAHGGVLVLDDVSEFGTSVLQGFVRAAETGSVDIVRADGRTSFPAQAQVIALANPCPCGQFGGSGICTCSAAQIRSYQGRVNDLVGSMVDMRIEIRPANLGEFANADEQASSADYREGVTRAQAFAAKRIAQAGEQGASRTSMASINLDDKARAFLEDFAQKARMSGRGIMKVLKVARTIADMAESEETKSEHVAEALSFRVQSQ